MGIKKAANEINQSERERWAGAVIELWNRRQKGKAWSESYRRARLTVYVYDQLLVGEDLGPVRLALSMQDAAIGLAVSRPDGQTHWHN